MVQLSIGGLVLGKAPLIKSIQYGTCSITNAGGTTATATITAVVTANSLLMFLNSSANTSFGDVGLCRITLTNTTTVTATTAYTPEAGNILNVNFCVIEFFPGIVKSNNIGTLSFASSDTSKTATITAVNTAKTMLSYLGASVGTLVFIDRYFANLTLTNTTTITGTRHEAANNALIVGYQAVEFY